MGYELTIAMYRWAPLVLTLLALGIVMASCGHATHDGFMDG